MVLALSSITVNAAELSKSPTPTTSSKHHKRHASAKAGNKVSPAHGAHRQFVASTTTSGARKALIDASDDLALKSSAAMVMDQDTGEVLAVKNPDVVLPIASLTKLMTALVVVEAKLPMDEILEIGSDDVDTTRHTFSRLTVGTRLRRDELLLLALMSSENRAAMALSRNYPGGRTAFISRMNIKAQALGMTSTHYADPAGLLNQSVSTARDLSRLLSAANAEPLIRSDTTQPEGTVIVKGRTLTFVNTNRLVRGAGDWDIALQKTGFTNEAGRCLVMEVSMLNRRLAMVFLDSNGTLTRYADAARVRRRLELEAKALAPAQHLPAATVATAASAKS